MLVLNANWLKAFRASRIQPITLLRIGWSTIYSVVSGDKSRFGYPASLVGTNPVSYSIDPLTKKIAVGSQEIKLRADGFLRKAMVDELLVGRLVTLYLGEASLVEGDYEQIWTGIITEVLPGEDEATIIAEDVSFSLLAHRNSQESYYAKHPLEIILALCTTFLPASLYDPATLDYTVYATFSHYLTSINWYAWYADHWDAELGGFSQGEEGRRDTKNWNVRELIEKIASVLPGYLTCFEDGVIRFTTYDRAASALRHWRRCQIRNFRQVTTFANLVNEVICHSHSVDGSYSVEYTADDTTAQAAVAYPGASGRVVSVERDFPGVRGVMNLADDLIADAGDVTVVLDPGGAHYFTGCKTNPASLLQDPVDAASVVRPVYMRIDDEIVEAYATSTGFYQVWVLDYLGVGSWDIRYGAFVFTVNRGALGTTIAAHTAGTNVIDLTPQIRYCNDVLERYPYGSPIVTLETNLAELEMQPGDLVSFDHDVYNAYQIDGADFSTVWQILAKEIFPCSGEICIRWKLQVVRDEAPLQIANLPDYSQLPLHILNRRLLVEGDHFGAVHVVDGFMCYAGIGLNATIEQGQLSADTGVYDYAEFTYDYDASSDTWVAADLRNGGYRLFVETIGDPPTGIQPFHRLLWRVNTGAGSINEIIDYRVLNPIQTDHIADEAVTTDKVADGAITLVKTSDIGAGAVFRWVPGATSDPVQSLYATALEVQSAMSQVVGRKVLWVSNQYGIPSFNFPWDLSDVTIVGRSITGLPVVIYLLNGAQILGAFPYIDNFIELNFFGTPGNEPVTVTAPGVNFAVGSRGSGIAVSGTGAFFNVVSGILYAAIWDNAYLDNSAAPGVPVIQVAAGATVITQMSNRGYIAANTIQGAVGSLWQTYTGDPSSFIVQPQALFLGTRGYGLQQQALEPVPRGGAASSALAQNAYFGQSIRTQSIVGAITVTIQQPPSAYPGGELEVVCDFGTYGTPLPFNVTIVDASGATIEGAATLVLTLQRQAPRLRSDGATPGNWMIVGGRGF